MSIDYLTEDKSTKTDIESQSKHNSYQTFIDLGIVGIGVGTLALFYGDKIQSALYNYMFF